MTQTLNAKALSLQNATIFYGNFGLVRYGGMSVHQR